MCSWRHTQTKAEDYVATSHANSCHRNVLPLSPARTGHIIYLCMYVHIRIHVCIRVYIHNTRIVIAVNLSVSQSVSQSLIQPFTHMLSAPRRAPPLLLGRTIKR